MEKDFISFLNLKGLQSHGLPHAQRVAQTTDSEQFMAHSEAINGNILGQ
ncbi:hypothetical protein Acr_25g0001430 [Actinidia rufa]|uniref:Uncharacterized protein n=1 Tax=Actinidia rufa TaxID=165716 RepID=A0A7J0GYZ5_9ERIC|nr:hypothetical protein Acr_25g0001430 [Actinidia rufa]